jgi:hypothetical protein
MESIKYFYYSIAVLEKACYDIKPLFHKNSNSSTTLYMTLFIERQKTVPTIYNIWIKGIIKICHIISITRKHTLQQRIQLFQALMEIFQHKLKLLGSYGIVLAN